MNAKNQDMPPMKALVKLAGMLRYTRTDRERNQIIRLLRLAEKRIDPAEEEPADEASELTALARRISLKCSGMKITGQVASRLAGRTYCGDVRAAIKELIEAGLATKVLPNLYEFKLSVSGQTVSVSKNIST